MQLPAIKFSEFLIFLVKKIANTGTSKADLKIFQNFFDPQNPCITICITVCITVVIFDQKSGNFKIFAGQISNFCITICITVFAGFGSGAIRQKDL